jgi:hypothetical protein
MEIPFTKLHGNGNDFVLIDEYEKIIIPDDMKGQFSAIYCDRRFGIGADGVIYLSKSEKARSECASSSPMRAKLRCAATASGALPNTPLMLVTQKNPAR